jgi:hypothetical protein
MRNMIFDCSWFKKYSIYLFLLLASCGLANAGRWHATLSFAGGTDNNVLESISSIHSDATGRLMIILQGKSLIGSSLNTQFQYQGGLEGYARYSKENRTINQVSGSLNLPFENRFGFGIRFMGRLKAFFRDVRGYGISQFSPYFRIGLGQKLIASLSYDETIMNYEAGKNYDYNQSAYGINLTWFVSSRMKLNFQWTSGVSTFDRDAFGYQIVSPGDSLWYNKNISQMDRIEAYSIDLEMLYWALVRIGFCWEKNDSNSYGYSSIVPEIHGLIVIDLPGTFYINLLGTRQWKKYQDSLFPILQIRPDSENEENSFIVTELSKDLGQKHTASIRFGWYRNESPFRNLYYEKTLISIGYAYAF